MEEVKENTKPSLLASLSEATETKTASKQNESFTWSFDEDKEKNPAKKEETKPNQDQSVKSETKTDKPGVKSEDQKNKPVTEAMKRESAATAAGMLDLLQRTICTPVLNMKFKKKFTEDETDKLDKGNLIDQKIDTLEGEELMLRNKWDRLYSKHQKKVDAVPMKDKEKENLEKAFYSYFQYKESSMPIEWYIGFEIANALGKRIIDVLSD